MEISTKGRKTALATEITHYRVRVFIHCKTHKPLSRAYFILETVHLFFQQIFTEFHLRTCIDFGDENITVIFFFILVEGHVRETK